VEGPNISTLLILQPGGNGTIPLTVYSPAQIPFNASLSVSLGESSDIQYSFSPTSFTVNPGQQVSSVLTITVDKDAPSELYWPGIDIQTNKQEGPYFIDGVGGDMPTLLIANSTPSCIYLVTEGDFYTTFSPSPSPFYTGQGPESYFPPPTINLSPGENTTIIFACTTQDSFNLNATAPTGLSAEFSPTPLNITLSWSIGKFYALTVTSSPNLNLGKYEVNTNATLGPYSFNTWIEIAVN
jgi:hypothetical protein